MKDITHLDYHALRRDSPKTARRAVLQVLKAQNGNVSKTARIFKISRATVYKAIEKDAENNLDDSSRAPHTVHNKTDTELETRVLQIRKQTALWPTSYQGRTGRTGSNQSFRAHYTQYS